MPSRSLSDGLSQRCAATAARAGLTRPVHVLLATALGLASVLLGACSENPPAWPFAPSHPPPSAQPEAPPAAAEASAAFGPRASEAPATAATIRPVLPVAEIYLRILLVQVPATESASAAKVWNHLREDVLDAATTQRLRRNGIRIGVGRVEWWEPVQVALNAVEGARSSPWDPVRIPPAYLLGLEMDTAPREQTVFSVEADGILSGGTFAQSRNVLQLMCLLDPRERQRVHLHVVPEVRQQIEEMQWVQTERGMMEVPRYRGQRFPAAGLSVPLNDGEFVVLAPSEQSRLYGLIGRIMLSEEIQARRYDSYVFLKPEVSYAADHRE